MQATATTLASLICSGYHEKKDGLKAKQIIDLVRMNHGVQIKYKKAWRTKEIDESLVRGTPEDSYHNLAKWLFKVQEKNIGSKVFLEIDKNTKVKYAFVAFGQSLRGFQHMRRVIAIDGTFLKSKFKGILLGASAQDGYFHLYPLAFGIVDSENEDSWTWFLRGLKTVIPDAADLVFVSDRAQSIASSLSTVYPLAHHGVCRVHFLKNVKSQFGKKALVESVEAAANSYTRYEFHQTFSSIMISNPKLATYLEEADFAKWARSYAPANRYNIMTTNIAESLNSLLNMPRELPVLSLLETIRMTLSNWFYERREKASRVDKYATPNVTDIIAGRFDDAMLLDVYQVDEYEFEVKDDTHKYVVHLQNRPCTCNVFDIDRIPCVHAIAAAKRTRMDEYKLVDPFYTKETWVKAYSESIHPCGDLSMCSYPDSVSDCFCGLPSTRQSSGIPPKKRKRSAGEFGVPGSKSQGHKCSRCGIGGHNKSTCRNRI
ncbi:Protein FAR1-RELATED SEQUENCE 8 [Cardamine amara subsp. amara]|uniref:Protein FAR1-RELATED SEQUENCE 8 n=1 Tax=Cardamine amara subsp. amara TaxID=228776 RepID=A0ABD1C6L2_CARAN